MVLAFGEIMLPALPPPDSATSSANLEIWLRSPTSSAIGATIKTATGINTPTAVIIIVAKDNAKIAIRSPKRSTIVRAIVLAAPESIMTPAKTPAAKTLTTVPITLWEPFTKMFTVCIKLAPPISDPKIAPINKEYTASTLRRIRIIAMANPIKAPHQETIIFTSPSMIV